MDGIETTRRIRNIVGPEVTIIIISAYDWEAIEGEAKAAGANLLVTKPLFKSTLISAFQEAKGNVQEPVRQDISKQFDFKDKRILVAEDNVINAEIAKSLLEHVSLLIKQKYNGPLPSAESGRMMFPNRRGSANGAVKEGNEKRPCRFTNSLAMTSSSSSFVMAHVQ